MPPVARAMVLSLDAADPGLVQELAAAGEMPATAGLLERAALVDTVAPEAVYVSANWPTLFTANQPDRHGYLCWDEIPLGSYERRQTTIDSARGAPLWKRLSEAGRRVAVLDVPHSRVEPLDGVMVAEYGCHDRHAAPSSWPPELLGELLGRHGAHFGSGPSPGFPQFAPCDYAAREGEHRTYEETEELVARLYAGVATKGAASLELLRRGGWDLFFSVLGEAHCVGHQLWHLHDTGHERHDAALVARLGGDPVREVYRRLDTVVGEHLAALGPHDTAYVTFAHGMTAHHDGTHLLDAVLARLDWALDVPEGLGAATRACARAAGLLPRGLRGPALRRAAPLVARRAGREAPAPLPPRAERRWFQIPNNTVVGAVRLNLAGREPLGRVLPEDRRAVVAWLAERLRELVNLETGGPVVTRCIVGEEAFERQEGDAFADLYLEWERSAPIERVWSPATGTVSIPYEHWRQGDHAREGLTLVTGPGIAPGRRRGVHRVVDLGATFAAAAGLVLDDVDGRPITSILPSGAPTAPAPSSGDRARRLAERVAARTRAPSPGWAAREAPATLRAVVALRDELEGRIAAGESVQAHLHARTEAVAAQARSFEAELADVRLRLEQLTALSADGIARAEGRADAAAASGLRLAGRVAPLERLARVAEMTAWLPQATVPEELLVSVVMPTRNRVGFLGDAIASVLAQSYGRFELLVVDDGSTDGTDELLAGLTDPRLRVLLCDGAGASTARNRALEVADGDLVAYLDDDNRFDRHWLRAVVATFLAHPDAHVAYGARIIDDEGRLHAGTPNARPWLHWLPWDPEAIRDYNLADMNVMAHRRGPERFDEELPVLGDWDLLLQLTRGSPPVEIPAIGAYYRTDAPRRLTDAAVVPLLGAEIKRVRRKAAALAEAGVAAPLDPAPG